MIKPRICACGRVLHTIAKRCPACSKVRLAEYRDRPRKFRVPTPDPDPKRCRAHLDWIATQPCAVRGCPGQSVAAHVRWNTGGGTAYKPADWWTIPLCDEHHREQHGTTHAAFDIRYGIDSRALAASLAALSPYLT